MTCPYVAIVTEWENAGRVIVSHMQLNTFFYNDIYSLLIIQLMLASDITRKF
jgi:hypothetical protein